MTNFSAIFGNVGYSYHIGPTDEFDYLRDYGFKLLINFVKVTFWRVYQEAVINFFKFYLSNNIAYWGEKSSERLVSDREDLMNIRDWCLFQVFYLDLLLP